MKNFFEKIYRFIRYDIWQITLSELTSTKRLGYNIVRTLVLAVRGFRDDKLNVRASALTYSIMFATVPILALMIGVARGFGFEDIIESALSDSFVGQANMVDYVMGFVQRYLETATGGVFVGVGIIALMWAILSFFMDLQQAFNDIWQVKSSSSYVRQFTTYLSILLLIPVLIITSTGLRIYLDTSASASLILRGLSPLIHFLLLLSPYFICWIMFLVIYMALPNTKVHFVNAGVAALITSIVFNLFQQIYIIGQVYLNRYNLVYGSFAAVPLLLLFIQVSCIIILLGAEIAYASQNVANFDYETDTNNISRTYKDFLSLYITRAIVQRFVQGQPALSAQHIAHEYHIPIRLTQQILGELVNAHVLIEVFLDPKLGKCYQPAVDVGNLTIGGIVKAVSDFGTSDFIAHPTQDMLSFRAALNDVIERKEEQHTLIKNI